MYIYLHVLRQTFGSLAEKTPTTSIIVADILYVCVTHTCLGFCLDRLLLNEYIVLIEVGNI